MERSSLALLRVAVERGYLDAEAAEGVRSEAALRRCSPERVLVERRLLSLRRLDRLRLHVRYREQRRGDKRYGKQAVRLGLLEPAALAAALAQQREVFEARRETLHLPRHLIVRGLLTEAEDRRVRRELAAASRFTTEESAQATTGATLPRNAASDASGDPRAGRASYRALEAALDRVEAIRAIQEDLSYSDEPLLASGGDSAVAFEDACRERARQRVGNVGSAAAPGERPARRARATKSVFGGRGAA